MTYMIFITAPMQFSYTYYYPLSWVEFLDVIFDYSQNRFGVETETQFQHINKNVPSSVIVYVMYHMNISDELIFLRFMWDQRQTQHWSQIHGTNEPLRELDLPQSVWDTWMDIQVDIQCKKRSLGLRVFLFTPQGNKKNLKLKTKLHLFQPIIYVLLSVVMQQDQEQAVPEL